MKIINIFLIILAVVILGGVSFNLLSLKIGLQKEVVELRTKAESLKAENTSLLRDIQYFSKKENLLKEIKSQFNYKEGGEGIIIIVPDVSSTDSR